ncbi:MAG: histidine utilization repressor [Methylobacteriaceae bacterium]|nr:histidine utilization repressor [Methylobacteriaceae bacterium]
MKPQETERAAGSLHQRIVADLESRILSGQWPPGHRIPFEVELSAAYGCSRMTVNKALGRLVDAGLIERRRKAGSFVARPRSQAAVLDIHDIRAEVTARGAAYRFEIVARARRAATPADRLRIDVPAGAPLIALRTLHYADDRPFCSEDRLISLAAVPEAGAEPFDALPPGAWLVARVPWTQAEHSIAARAATKEQAARLDIAPGAPCLVVERRTWRAGEPVTGVELAYPGALHRLVARFAPTG